MRSLDERERRIAIATIVIVSVALAYQYVIEPVAFTWLTVYREAERAEQELQKLEFLVERRAEIEQEYQRLETVAAAIASREAMTISLLSEVTELAQRGGLAVVGIKPLKSFKERGYERAGVQVELEGEAHQFVKFLQGLQEEKHLLNSEFVNVLVGRGTAPLTISMRLNKLFFLDTGVS